MGTAAAVSTAAVTQETSPVSTTPKPARHTRRHLIDFQGWQPDELMALLDTADVMAQVLTRTIKKVPALQGFTVATLFFEDSTRTRLSFERAARAQSADVIAFAAGSSSLKKGEGIKDTLRTLEQLQADLYVVRHPAAGVPRQLTRWTDAAVVNAGDGRHAHPTQALLDAYTFRSALAIKPPEGAPLAPFTGRRLAIVGDIEHSRVARSNVELFTKLGAEVVLCGPATLLPRELAQLPGVTITHSLEAAVEGADAVMALRLQRERMSSALLPSEAEYVARYQLTERAMRLAKDHAIVMHPGPINRDVEISSDLADGPRSVIEQQVANGVSVRMAVLYTLLVGKR